MGPRKAAAGPGTAAAKKRALAEAAARESGARLHAALHRADGGFDAEVVSKEKVRDLQHSTVPLGRD